MQVLTIRSNAKLNLTFEILGDLPGGYHSVRTVFQSIDLADELKFVLEQTAASDEFQVAVSASANIIDLPLDENNLIVKAARKFSLITGCGAGFKLNVHIDKNIPIAAGMAGGSSNAAATLFAMHRFFQESCTESQTDEIAASIGSDINFCLHGGTQLGTNRGELLHPVESARELVFLIVKPRDIAISTPWIYRQYDDYVRAKAQAGDFVASDDFAPSGKNHSQSCIDALDAGDVNALAGALFNSFEEICFSKFPDVRYLRDSMLKAGCLSAKITGSGPTLFGLVSDWKSGETARDALMGIAVETNFHCWLVRSCNKGLVVSSESS